jgi:hypothetical protein
MTITIAEEFNTVGFVDTQEKAPKQIAEMLRELSSKGIPTAAATSMQTGQWVVISYETGTPVVVLRIQCEVKSN